MAKQLPRILISIVQALLELSGHCSQHNDPEKCTPGHQYAPRTPACPLGADKGGTLADMVMFLGCYQHANTQCEGLKHT